MVNAVLVQVQEVQVLISAPLEAEDCLDSAWAELLLCCTCHLCFVQVWVVRQHLVCCTL